MTTRGDSGSGGGAGDGTPPTRAEFATRAEIDTLASRIELLITSLPRLVHEALPAGTAAAGGGGESRGGTHTSSPQGLRQPAVDEPAVDEPEGNVSRASAPGEDVTRSRSLAVASRVAPRVVSPTFDPGGVS